MEAEDVLNLFDVCWFEIQILKETPFSTKSTSSEYTPEVQIEENQQIPLDSPNKPKLSHIETIHTRSMSDSLASLKLDSFSPDSVLVPSKLKTILSGKEVTDTDKEVEPMNYRTSLFHLEDLQTKKKRDIRRRKNKKERKSFSDLEFEELKGFMDLGFVFSEEDKDSNLASIIPGLHRFGKRDIEIDEEEEKGDFEESEISRPYLSEAWKFHERRRNQKEKSQNNLNPVLMNWRVPSSNNEIDVKDSLKLWAHTVASTVR